MRQLRIKELACYQRLTDEQKERARLRGDTAFAVPQKLDDDLQEQLLSYIRFRGETLSIDSLRGELWTFHAICRFFLDRHPGMKDVCSVPEKDLERSLKAWMMVNGYALNHVHEKLVTDEKEVRISTLITFLRKLYSYSRKEEDVPETDKDIWRIEKLPFAIRGNPVKSVRTFNFTPIIQDGIRREVKDVFITTGRYLSIGTLLQQLHAVKRLAAFLLDRYPKVTSLTMLDREMIEDFLTYLNTEATGKKSFRSELASLKSVLDTLSLIKEEPKLQGLFVEGDITDRGRIRGYRAYSDEEVKMWNEAIRTLPEQVARALVIHQLLGNRISETLTLKQDCICKRGGHAKVRVFQVKRQNTVYKPANETVIKLIEKSAAYTRKHFGQEEYVFVNGKDPGKPMSYACIQYQLMKLIREKNLRDANGQLYGVGTHSFRHTMGQRLTQMHIDDKTIASLLGHSGTGSVGKYRSFGSKALADETRNKRNKYDSVLKDVRKGW